MAVSHRARKIRNFPHHPPSVTTLIQSTSFGCATDLMNSPPSQFHLPHWLQAIVASAGGLGLFLIAFLDSSILTFPVINDLLLINLSVRYPARMPYYAAMATLGSVVGCLLLYFLARKGGEAMFHK